jgi:hypothetical protein
MKPVSVERLEELRNIFVKNEKTGHSDPIVSYNELIAIADELIRYKKSYAFLENQNRCLGYNENNEGSGQSCDGDLVGMAHEKHCPAYQLDKDELRPYLYEAEERSV